MAEAARHSNRRIFRRSGSAFAIEKPELTIIRTVGGVKAGVDCCKDGKSRGQAPTVPEQDVERSNLSHGFTRMDTDKAVVLIRVHPCPSVASPLSAVAGSLRGDSGRRQLAKLGLQNLHRPEQVDFGHVFEPAGI